MRRALLALTVGGALSACGLSLSGVESSEGPEAGTRPMPESSAPVVNGSDEEEIEASVPVVTPRDARAETTTDARPPAIVNCRRTDCAATDSSCSAERCGIANPDQGGPHWLTRSYEEFDDQKGYCNSKASDNAAGSFKSTAAMPAPNRFAYELHVNIVGHKSTNAIVSKISAGGLEITVAYNSSGSTLQLCVGSQCTTPKSAYYTDPEFSVYGVIDRAGGYGSAFLIDVDVNSSCAALGNLDFVAPVTGDLKASVGCFPGTVCEFDWHDAVFDLTPL